MIIRLSFGSETQQLDWALQRRLLSVFVTFVCFLKCLRGCQDVCSDTPGGIEEWLLQRTASRGSRAFCQMFWPRLSPTFCPFPTKSWLLGESRFCFIKGLLHCAADPFSLLCIQRGAITQSLLFDLAAFKSELPFLFTLQSDTVNKRVCLQSLCLCVLAWTCVKLKSQEDAWILGSGLCGKISQEASPLSSILQAEKERKKGTGSFTSHFTTVQGLCVYRWSLPVFLTIQYVITLEMGIRLMREVAVQKSPGQLQTRTSRFSGCSLTISLSIRTSGSCREAKGALQTDSLHFWNIYLRVYRQLNSFHDASVLPELRNVASSPRLMPVCALFQLKKQTLHDNDRK